jgi:hypothetical protein
MKLTIQKPDTIGAIASTLCLIHCIATPFLFITQSCSLSCCESSPGWWSNIDFLFLTISFFSIYHSIKTSTNDFVKRLLWINWLLLLVLIINQKLQLILITETVTHITSITLAVIHIYNLKFCQCKNEKCCAKNG